MHPVAVIDLNHFEPVAIEGFDLWMSRVALRHKSRLVAFTGRSRPILDFFLEHPGDEFSVRDVAIGIGLVQPHWSMNLDKSYGEVTDTIVWLQSALLTLTGETLLVNSNWLTGYERSFMLLNEAEGGDRE